VTYTAASDLDPDALRNSGHHTGFRHVTGAEVLCARAVTKLTEPRAALPLGELREHRPHPHSDTAV
jgi:hypothetical protein